MSFKNPLLVLIAAIPVVVLLAGLAAYLLLRAGYGLVVSGLVPFVGLTVVSVALGLVLGRAAEAGRNRNGKRD